MAHIQCFKQDEDYSPSLKNIHLIFHNRSRLGTLSSFTYFKITASDKCDKLYHREGQRRETVVQSSPDKVHFMKLDSRETDGSSTSVIPEQWDIFIQVIQQQ